MYLCVLSSTAQTHTTPRLKSGNGNFIYQYKFYFFFFFCKILSLDLKYLQGLQGSRKPDYVTGLNIRQGLSFLAAGGSLLPDLEATAPSSLAEDSESPHPRTHSPPRTRPTNAWGLPNQDTQSNATMYLVPAPVTVFGCPTKRKKRRNIKKKNQIAPHYLRHPPQHCGRRQARPLGPQRAQGSAPRLTDSQSPAATRGSGMTLAPTHA